MEIGKMISDLLKKKFVGFSLSVLVPFSIAPVYDLFLFDLSALLGRFDIFVFFLWILICTLFGYRILFNAYKERRMLIAIIYIPIMFVTLAIYVLTFPSIVHGVTL